VQSFVSLHKIKHLMKKILIFIPLFFIFFYTFSQNSKNNRIINWQNPKSVSHYFNIEQKNINKTEILVFDNACYNQNSLLPYYYELIKVNSPSSEIKVANIKYKQLTREELLVLKNKNTIPEKIEYESIINYIRSKPYIQFSLLPFRKNSITGQIEKVVSFEIAIAQSSLISSQKNTRTKSYGTSSVLRTGNWVKIKLNKNGVYKITYSELTEMGFTNPGSIRIYGNSSGLLPISNTEESQDDLTGNDIFIEKGSDGVFNSGDYILFYAKSADQWNYNESTGFYDLTNHIYSDYNYFFLTTNAGSTGTINTATTPSGAATQILTTFTYLIQYENDTKNLIESGQLWFGEHFDITTSYDFDFSIPDRTATSIQCKVVVAARSSEISSFNIKSGAQTIANVSIPKVEMSGELEYANSEVAEGNFTSSSDNFSININYNKSSSSSEGWLDYICLNAERKIKLSKDQLIFNYYNSGAVSEIIEFQIQNASSAIVWDVTDPNHPQKINTPSIGGGTVEIKVNAAPGLNEYIAFNNSNFLITEEVGEISNQNLHAINHKDMIIVTHPDFISQASEIATIHETTDNISVVIVTPEQIYNEFSSGSPDASAIRNFVRMVYERATSSDTLKYLLFVGDGSYDHKSITAENNNFILTYQSTNSLSPTGSFVTDDFFGLLDATDNVENSNSGLVDIGIGRLTVRSSEEAQQMVDKIKSYLDFGNYGDWMNSICFVADDEDGNTHMIDADKLATFVDTTYPYLNINKIYLDAFPQESSAIYESYPEVNRLVKDEVNNGVLIFNYTGHGGENGLAHERILSIDDINSWVNFNKLAIFMTATCEFSRFDNHKYTSAGEHVLLNPNGGAIVLFSTTRLVYSGPNYILNRNFYNYIFEKDNEGNDRAFGDIMRLTKNASGTGNNKRNFTLLGDPAIKMHIPEYDVITDSINHRNVNDYTDTLKALSKVTIHGHIENSAKSIISNYNGIVYPVVLDKKKTITTLGNDGDTPMDFEVQNNTLFKGKASVINGKFEFSFVVPKDISYNFDNGKISFYSKSSNSDAKGFFKEFLIGGTDENAEPDNFGPEIRLYMNDENFVSGGVTNESPKLIAILSDSSGINTVGNGIGHDITVTLDKNSSDIIVLNDYYESDLDEYQSGKIEYLFSELENGDHNLKLKVWDVYNNSSEGDMDFIVAESENLAIRNLLNYPNPFTESTAFYFDHNRPNEDLDILIQIFTVSGKLVKTITSIINSNAFRSDPIRWDGLDDFGDNIGRGVYIYQIRVRTFDGEIVKKIEKLVILK
jgi:Peptidase family C25